MRWSLRIGALLLVLLAFPAGRYLDLNLQAAALFLTAITLAGASFWPALVRPAARLRAEGLRTAIALLFPLAATALVATATSREPQLHSYWGWFALWIAAVASVPFLAGLGLEPKGLASVAKRHALEIGLIGLLVLTAFFVRALNIATTPEPYSGDEASFAIRGIWVMEGSLRNMFRSGLHGTPNLYFFFLALFEKLGGVTVAAARMSSVVIGVLSVLVTFVWLRQAYGRTAAMAGATFISLYHLHIQFSRQSMLNISDTVFIPLVMLFAYRAMREGKPLDYAVAGLVLGLSLYGWASVRLLPFEIAALWGWRVVTARRLPPGLIPGITVFVLSGALAAAPLGWWWLHHVNEFNTRWNQVGIHQRPVPGAKTWFEGERERGRSTLDIYRKQVKDTVNATFFTKERGNFYSSPIPLVDHLTALPMLIGLAWALYHSNEPRYFVLPIMFAGALVGGGVLTAPPVSSARLLGIVPPLAALVGIGAERTGAFFAAGRQQWLAPIALAAVLFVSVFGLDFYFGRYAHGRYYSDNVTRDAERYGESVRASVPPGFQVYWRITDVVNPGHPALAWGLRDYVLTAVEGDGHVVGTWNPHLLTAEGAGTAYLFAGRAVAEANAMALICPGGNFYESRNPRTHRVDLRIYAAPPGRCPLGPSPPPNTRGDFGSQNLADLIRGAGGGELLSAGGV